MQSESSLVQRAGRSAATPARDAAERSLRALACAAIFPVVGLALSLCSILGPPRFALNLAYELGGLLFIAGTVGLGFAFASSLTGR